MVTTATQLEIEATESLDSPVTLRHYYEKPAPPTTFVVLPGFAQFIEESPALRAGNGAVRLDHQDQLIPVELCDIDRESNKPIVPGFDVMQERIVANLSEAKKTCAENGQVVLVCYSLACLLTAGMTEEQLQGVDKFIFVSPVFANDKGNELIDLYKNITEPTLDSKGRYFITLEFIQSLKNVDAINQLRGFYLRFGARVSTIIASNDELANNELLIAFLKNSYTTLNRADLQVIEKASHSYSTPDMQKGLADAISHAI